MWRKIFESSKSSLHFCHFLIWSRPLAKHRTPNTQHPTMSTFLRAVGTGLRSWGKSVDSMGTALQGSSVYVEKCASFLYWYFFTFFQFFRLTVCSPPPPPPPPPPPRSHFVSPRFKKIFPCSSKHSLHPKTTTKTLSRLFFFSFHLFSFSPTQTIQYILIFFLSFFSPI